MIQSVITGWWGQWTEAVIDIPTGIKFVVVDADSASRSMGMVRARHFAARALTSRDPADRHSAVLDRTRSGEVLHIEAGAAHGYAKPQRAMSSDDRQGLGCSTSSACAGSQYGFAGNTIPAPAPRATQLLQAEDHGTTWRQSSSDDGERAGRGQRHSLSFSDASRLAELAPLRLHRAHLRTIELIV